MIGGGDGGDKGEGKVVERRRIVVVGDRRIGVRRGGAGPPVAHRNASPSALDMRIYIYLYRLVISYRCFIWKRSSPGGTGESRDWMAWQYGVHRPSLKFLSCSFLQFELNAGLHFGAHFTSS